jgi:hypothetical protein
VIGFNDISRIFSQHIRTVISAFSVNSRIGDAVMSRNASKNAGADTLTNFNVQAGSNNGRLIGEHTLSRHDDDDCLASDSGFGK